MLLNNATTLSRRGFLRGAMALAGKNLLPALPTDAIAVDRVPAVIMAPFTNLAEIYQKFKSHAVGLCFPLWKEELKDDIPYILSNRIHHAPHSLMQLAQCGAELIALSKVKNLDEFLLPLRESYDDADQYIIGIGDKRPVPRNKAQIESLLADALTVWFRDVRKLIDVQSAESGPPLPLAWDDIKIYFDQTGLYSHFEHQLDERGVSKNRLPDLTRDDLNFLVEKAFLENYGFQCRHYALSERYRRILDQWQDHPFILLRQWKRYSHEPEGAKGFCDFNQPIQALRSFTEAEIGELKKLNEYVTTKVGRSYRGMTHHGYLSFNEEFLGETKKLDAENISKKITRLIKEKAFKEENKRFDSKVTYSSLRDEQSQEYRIGYIGVMRLHYPQGKGRDYEQMKKNFRKKLQREFGEAIKINADVEPGRDEFVLTLRATNDHLETMYHRCHTFPLLRLISQPHRGLMDVAVGQIVTAKANKRLELG